MDLNHLQVFVAVARAGSFTEASLTLGLPKSSVSRAVASLEEELGVRLLHRTTRSLGLSTAGAELFERVAGPLAALRDAVETLPAADGEPAGVLRLTATADFAEAFMAGLVARYVQLFPRVSVDLRLTERVVDLANEGVDLAVRFAMQGLPDAGLVARRVGATVFGLYASPGWIARRGMPRHLNDLRVEDLVLHRGVWDQRPVFGEAGDLPREGTPGLMADAMSFVRAALVAGMGVGLLPGFYAVQEVEGGRLVRVLPRLTIPGGNVYLVMPSGRQVPPKVRAFIDLFVSSFRGW